MRKKKQPTPKTPPPEEPKRRFITLDMLDMEYAGPARRPFSSVESEEEQEEDGYHDSDYMAVYLSMFSPGDSKHLVRNFSAFAENITLNSPFITSDDVDTDIGKEIVGDKKLLSILLLGYFFGLKHGTEDMRHAMSKLMESQ